MLFQVFIFGFIVNGGGGTLTSLYQSSCSQTRYWSFTKFLSRGKWDTDAVAALMTKLLQHAHAIWVYVYDETKAIKTGKSQWRLHFFPNFSFHRCRPNQSKYQLGHQFGALGLLCQTATGWTRFPVWVKLMCPQKTRDKVMRSCSVSVQS